MKKLLAFFCIASLGLLFFACAAPADYSILDNITITIGDISIQAHDLHQNFEITELDVERTDSIGQAQQLRARGVLLEAVLRANGLSQADFASIVALGDDGYSIAIPAEILRNRDILLAFSIDGEIIEPRIVIPGERAMYWVKYLRELALVQDDALVEIVEVFEFDELIEWLSDYVEDFHYYDALTRALPIAPLLEAILQAEPPDFVTITATDGLIKTERFRTFAGQLIVFDGTEDAPLFIGPDLPVGMRVRNIESIQIGEILLVM